MEICVIGAGRIGLPISVSLAMKGYRVLVLELDGGRCEEINNSRAPFYEDGMDDALAEVVTSGLLTASQDSSKISDCNVIISAIGTEVSDDGTPDVSAIGSMVGMLSPHLNSGDLFLLKTTLPIGSTQEIGEKLSENSGLALDEQLFVAFSPERIVEGRAPCWRRDLEPSASFNFRFLESWRRNCCEPQISLGIYTLKLPL